MCIISYVKFDLFFNMYINCVFMLNLTSQIMYINYVFRYGTVLGSILDAFRVLFDGLGVKKELSKCILKCNRFFDLFFKDLGSFWDLPGPPRIDKKEQKKKEACPQRGPR